MLIFVCEPMHEIALRIFLYINKQSILEPIVSIYFVYLIAWVSARFLMA